MRTGTGRGRRRLAVSLVIGAVAVAGVACGAVPEGDDHEASGPAAGDPTADDPRGVTDGLDCRPPLGPEDPHPIVDGDGGQHPDLVGIEATLDALQEAVETVHADVLAGLWLDQAEGQIVVMLTGDDRGAVLADLRDQVDHPDLVVCMEADFTQAELEGLQATINEAASGPFSTGIDTVANRVTASIETDADAVVAALEATLSDRELAAVDLEVPACAEVEPIPDGGVALPGGGSTCGGMGALASGELVGDDECVWLDGPDGVINLAWPRGWWLDAAGTVHDHQGADVASIGDQVDVGGGFLGAPTEMACGPNPDEAWLVVSLSTAD